MTQQDAADLRRAEEELPVRLEEDVAAWQESINLESPEPDEAFMEVRVGEDLVAVRGLEQGLENMLRQHGEVVTADRVAAWIRLLPVHDHRVVVGGLHLDH